MLTKFLDPKNDFAFKKIFGTEKNKDILIHFLNDMLTFKDRALIQDVTFLKTIQDPETASKKTSIVDILCKDEKDNRYIVEMQVAKEKGFEKRAQYYASKAYISQAHAGGEYHNLKEVIFLAIAEFIMFPKKKHWKSEHVILDKDSYEHDLKDFSFTFLELPKFQKSIHELSSISDKWMYFFKNAEKTSEKELEKLVGKDMIIERAYEELDRFHWNEEELLTYDQAEKYEGAYIASMAQKYDEGLEKGRIEGMEKGREEGRTEGLEKGREEGLEKGLEKGKQERELEIAKSLLLQGVDVDIIISTTQLSKEEIEKLQSS
ncbi:MAG: transposase [Alphaproteobacteria bacterium RIFCSPHIGHO2_12_42_13]|nr:MAG: transposase [Alphaproteobacteria bacterium GWA2_41_27]OFW93593.1 MAG: transposase [Alphaproteobacteria bacterium RIFCSPHIGHO2_12_42_13]